MLLLTGTLYVYDTYAQFASSQCTNCAVYICPTGCLVLSLQLVWQNGAHRIPVLPSDITTEITGGVLHLPAIPIKRHWFDVHNRGTATLLLLDTESVLQQQTAPQQSPEQQQQPVDEADVLYHAPELGRVHVRLAPYAEQLSVLPAGCVFEGVRVTGRFGAELDKEETRLLMVRDLVDHDDDDDDGDRDVDHSEILLFVLQHGYIH